VAGEVREETGVRCRIYAPVGAHRDLLAYLVRRLLENGANSSFVNRIVDKDLPAEAVAADPLAEVEAFGAEVANPRTSTTGGEVALIVVDDASRPRRAPRRCGPLWIPT